MTLQTDHYYSLTCNGRVNNVVSPNCGATSDGRWHDAELMEKEAEQAGWTKTTRGHLCPNCSRAASATVEAAETKPRKTRVKPTPPDPQTPPHAQEWDGPAE